MLCAKLENCSAESYIFNLWCILQLLRNLAGAANLKAKISQMFAGEHLNVTEDRAVLHPALRAPRDEVTIQQL